MKKKQINIVLIAFLLFTISCKKDPSTVGPKLSFVNAPGYVSSDTTLQLGAQINVMLSAEMGSSKLTYLRVTLNNGTTIQTALDTGFNINTLQCLKKIIKTTAENEVWTFLVMDRNRNESSITLNIKKKPTVSWGDITIYNSVILGAQGSALYGSFLSLSDGKIYFQDSAYIMRNNVDMIYYYGIYNSTLSSPGETQAPNYFTVVPPIGQWVPKNVTMYDTTALTVTDFDNSNNDSLILNTYNDLISKKKAKYLASGSIYAFKTQSGKMGLVKVNNVDAGATGHVNLSIKIQK
jgi:hypothetical protein